MAPGRTDHDAPAVRLTAAEFLDAAARAALRQPATPPRRGQWVLSVTEEQPGRKTLTWLPVTGNHDEVIRGFDHGSGGVGSACTVAQGERGFWYKPVTQHTPDGNITMYEVNPHEYVGQPHGYCIPDAGYFPDMPARARSLWAYLTRTHIVLLPSGQAAGLTQADRTNEVGRAVIDLVSDTYLLPAQRAGLFRLMASTAGFRVVPGVRDAIGRAGVAIEWHYMGFTSAIIFSPRTYAFLGDNAWSGGWSHGSDVSSGGTVLIEQKVVAAPPPDRQGG